MYVYILFETHALWALRQGVLCCVYNNKDIVIYLCFKLVSRYAYGLDTCVWTCDRVECGGCRGKRKTQYHR